MDQPDCQILTAERCQERFRHCDYFILLSDFKPRSFAQGDVPLDSEVTWEEIRMRFPGFDEFDLELRPKSWRMALKRNGHAVEIGSSGGKAHIEVFSEWLDAEAVLEMVSAVLEMRVLPRALDRGYVVCLCPRDWAIEGKCNHRFGGAPGR